MSHGHDPDHDPQHDQPPAHPAGGHETRDVRARTILIYAGTLTAVLVVVHLGLLAIYRRMREDRGPEPSVHAPINLYEQLRALRRAEDETLDTYGWVDRKEGV